MIKSCRKKRLLSILFLLVNFFLFCGKVSAYGGKEYNDYCNANYPQYGEQCQSARDMEDALLSAFNEAGIPVRVTSSFRRPGAAGNAGNASFHVSGNAIDLAPIGMSYEELEKRMVESEIIRSYFSANGLGLLNETTSGAMQSTGATGKHFHIGPDRKALAYWNALLNGIDGNTFNLESTPKSEAGIISNYVEALEIEDCREFKVGLESHYATYSYNYNGVSHTGPINLYNATETCENKNKYYAFCYDPKKAFSTAGSNPYEFTSYINPFDGEPAFPSPGDGSTKQEAFIYYIYKKYGDQLSNAEIRGGIVIAIRAYQQIIDGSASSDGKNLVFWQLANSWECENSSNSMCHIPSKTIADINFGDLESTAKSIYLEAKRVADTCSSTGCSGLEEVGVKWSTVEKTVCESAGGTLIKKAQGSVEGLNTYKGTYTYIEPICPADLTCELRINNSVVARGSSIPVGSKYEMWVKGSSSAFSKAEGDVGIKVRATSKEDYHNVILLTSVSDPGGSQRFVAFLDNTMAQVISISLTDISNLTCGKCGTDPMLTPGNSAFNKEMYIAKCCDDPSADPTWCPTKKDVCFQTNWNLVCGGSGEIYEIQEGISQLTHKINYKKCILGENSNELATDPANNPYKILQNRYCTVSCKEDWKFTMPGPLGVHKAGTYMILGGNGQNPLKVYGSRTCVAGNGTNKQTTNNEILTRYKNGLGSFQADLVDIDNKIVDAINRYSEAAAYVYWFDKQSTKTSETKNYSCGGGNVSKCGSVVSKVDRSATLGDKRILNGSVKFRKIIFRPQTSYDANGKLGTSEINVEFAEGYTEPKCKNGTTCGYIELINDGDDCKSDCHGDVVEAKQDYGYDTWVSKRDRAKSEYNRLIAERQEMIDDITECNTWENNFKFEPEISYMYQEQDYMNMLQGNNKFQIEGGGTPAVAVKESIYRDNESKSDDYTKISGNSQGSEYQQGNTNNIFTCDLRDDDNRNGFISKCHDDHQKMYYSSSILLSKQADYTYEIKGRWYTIHDSGSSMYLDSDTNAANETTTLIGFDGTPKGGDGKVLPISENTRPGEYNYQLRFVDVGQYNGSVDNQKLGRLIGGEDRAHTGVKSVFAALKGYKNINTGGLISGELGQTYKCTYNVENKNPCVSKIKTEIISLLDCPDGYRCSGYGNNSSYIDATGDVSFFVRTVSLNDLNPNNRNIGSNWTEEIINEIENLGDEAYAKTPEYSFTIAPQGLVALKEQVSLINYGAFELRCDKETGDNCINDWLTNLTDIDGVTINNLRGK